ncbi:carbohydrate sulfotransferase 11-like [Ruditapes philippinarum]|uniref:carbohydrate sulfotransferase 11-like n=1 Tax=Ruditapes philippinarum TaxID=129788 RepID=UPI00295C14A7|nr:carbohydrate sulfotransferase 11-like [Ruditapes philippinarum]
MLRLKLKKLVLLVVLTFLLTVTTYLRYQMFLEANNVKPEVVVPLPRPRIVLNKADEMKERIAHMHRFCSQYPKRRRLVAMLKTNVFYISEKYKLSYCRVAKVGSTFWTQVFMTLAGIKPQDGQSLFNVPRDESHDQIKEHEELTMDLKDDRINNFTSFMVARNPYSRLFSSYIDQIFLPNKWYVASFMIFGTEKGSRKRCGNDVTFDEFLRTVSRNTIRRMPNDLHWAPIFSICLPCDTKIDMLAKHETFNEDAEYILNVTGVEQTTRDEVDRVLKENYISHSLSTLVHTYVTKAHDRTQIRKGCITEIQIAERIWKAFQIQGYIHNDLHFPAAEFKSSSASETEKSLTKLVSEASELRPLTSQERNTQRHNWQIYYWKTVTPEVLLKVQDAYYEDFLLFNYDFDPNTM